MATMRNLFEELDLSTYTLPLFLEESEVMYNFNTLSKKDIRNYFTSTFKNDVTSLQNKYDMFIAYFGRECKVAAFFPHMSKPSDLHLDIFPLVH